MKEYPLVIVGGGPAGLSSAIEAATHGVKVLLIERANELGGQLVKQTHKFFGSKKQYASIRGFDIARKLLDQITEFSDLIEIRTSTFAVGLYPDKVLSCLFQDKYYKIKFQTLIIATGASEKFLAFENNDLPGIYGAGAIQTLMNQYGVLPGKKVLMVGSGNIGLIVSYQLRQAGVDVVGIIEASSKIGGYLVHASKIRRIGIPIYLNRTVTKAIGDSHLEKVYTSALNDSWQVIPNTEIDFEVDALCIAVGLNPMHPLLSMANIEMKYIKELGGNVPIIDHTLETSFKGIFVCGDVCGIEEASSAMVEGRIAGLNASIKIGKKLINDEERLIDLEEQLHYLRSGPFGTKTRIGLEKLGVIKHD